MEELNNSEEENYQARIALITSRLRSEVNRAGLAHRNDLQRVASDCRHALDELSHLLDTRFREAEENHKNNILSIEEEIDYLRELCSAQHQMLQDSITYIRELEERFRKNDPAPGA